MLPSLTLSRLFQQLSQSNPKPVLLTSPAKNAQPPSDYFPTSPQTDQKYENTRQYYRFHNWNYAKAPYQNQFFPVLDKDTLAFSQKQFLLMSVSAPKPDPVDPDAPQKEFLEKIKLNIDRLGGIEDTVGAMQNSLNEFEINHMIYRRYRNPNQEVKIFRFNANRTSTITLKTS